MVGKIVMVCMGLEYDDDDYDGNNDGAREGGIKVDDDDEDHEEFYMRMGYRGMP